MQSFGTNEFFGIDLLIGLKLISAQGGGGGAGGGNSLQPEGGDGGDQICKKAVRQGP